MKTDLQITGHKQSPKSANSMKVLLLMLLTLLAISCSYDEDMEVCAVSVKLAFGTVNVVVLLKLYHFPCLLRYR